MTRTGTERKNSTTIAQNQRMTPIRDMRPTPKTNPKIPARTMEIAAALRVLYRPGSR